MSSGESDVRAGSVPGSDPPGATMALRAQMLATEHWSLLATRGLTWSEVMSRISIHLTVASASLVVLALMAQASGFGQPFRVAAIGLASAILVLGTLTAVRVTSASLDDAALVAGMNRLRAAYLEMDPSIADYLVTSWHDDQPGVMRTYRMGADRHPVSHVVGSTRMFVDVVNSIVAGTLGALVASTAGLAPGVVAAVGVVAGLAYLAVMIEIGRRVFGRPVLAARFPAPPGSGGDQDRA